MKTATMPTKNSAFDWHSITWTVEPEEMESAPRWDEAYFDPAMLEIQRLAARHRGSSLCRYADVRDPGTVRKSHSDEAFAALAVRDIEPGLIVPHVPRYLLQPPKRNWVAAGEFVVTKTGVFGVTAPILDFQEFWNVIGMVYTARGGSISITSDVLAARVKDTRLSPAILAAYISYPIGRILIRRVVYGAGGQHLRREDLESVHVPECLAELDKPYQALLREFYDSLGALVRQGRELVDAKAMAEAETISKQMFHSNHIDGGRWDFGWPLFERISKIAENLGFSKLSDRLRVFAPGAPKKAERGFLIFGTRDVKPHMMLPRGEKPRIVSDIRASNWARPGDVLIAAVGGALSTGTTALVVREGLPFINKLGFSILEDQVAVSGDYLTLRPLLGKGADEQHWQNAAEATLFLNSPFGRLQVMNLAVTTKQTRVRHYEFGEIRMPFGFDGKLAGKYKQLATTLNRIRTLVDQSIPELLGVSAEIATMLARPYTRNILDIAMARQPRGSPALLPFAKSAG